MSTTLESLHIPRGWSKAYINQLASYIRHRDDMDSWYYGNREQFEKRHKAILEWIEQYEIEIEEHCIKFRQKTSKDNR